MMDSLNLMEKVVELFVAGIIQEQEKEELLKVIMENKDK